MSNERDKEKHSRRLHADEVHIAKQLKIAKSHGFPVKRGQEHRLHKLSGTTCGDSNCAMCGNPRKFFKDPTIQEKSFDQVKLHDESKSNMPE